MGSWDIRPVDHWVCVTIKVHLSQFGAHVSGPIQSNPQKAPLPYFDTRSYKVKRTI